MYGRAPETPAAEGPTLEQQELGAGDLINEGTSADQSYRTSDDELLSGSEYGPSPVQGSPGGNPEEGDNNEGHS